MFGSLWEEREGGREGGREEGRKGGREGGVPYVCEWMWWGWGNSRRREEQVDTCVGMVG